MEIITSIKNPIVKEISKLHNKKHRTDFFIVEGKRSIQEIPPDWHIEKLILSDIFNFDLREFPNLMNIKPTFVSENVMNKISETVTSSGIICICKMKTYKLDDILSVKNPFLVICESINDPGNLGSLIRTADASGASGVLLSNSCVDLYNSKVIRSSMGSIFHIPIITNIQLSDLFTILKINNISTYGAFLNTENTLYSQPLTEPTAILIGNEANGLTPETIDKCDNLFKIPMPGKAESLNASVAFGIIAFEVVRQREMLK